LNRLTSNTPLLIEIEALRKHLHKVIELSGGDLLSEDVLELSKKLDSLLVKFLKEEQLQP